MFQKLFGGVFGEELEDVGKGEAVLLGKGDVDAVVGGSGLQLEVEASAEALTQGETPGFVDTTAKRSMKNELHATTIIEEAFGDDGGLGGDGSEGGAAGDDVGDELVGSAGADAALLHEPGCGSGNFGLCRGDITWGEVGSERGNLFAELTDTFR